MTGVILAQIVVVVTLILMIIGKTPMYITAVVGSTIAALQAGIPLYGVDPVTIKSLLIGGLNPVLIDMGGILLFICIMQSTGFLHVIIGDIIKADNYIGGGPGIITAAAAVAGGIGMMVGFTQAAITQALSQVPQLLSSEWTRTKPPVRCSTRTFSAAEPASLIRLSSAFWQFPGSATA